MKKTLITTIIAIVFGFFGWILHQPTANVKKETVYQIIPITKNDLIEQYEAQLRQEGFNDGYQQREIDRAWSYALNQFGIEQEKER